MPEHSLQIKQISQFLSVNLHLKINPTFLLDQHHIFHYVGTGDGKYCAQV